MRPQFGVPPDKFGISFDESLYDKFLTDQRLPDFGKHLFTFNALHELGHVIGLGHVGPNCVGKSVMALPRTKSTYEDPGWVPWRPFTYFERFPLYPTPSDVEGLLHVFQQR